MTTKPQLHPLLRVKSSRTRRKCFPKNSTELLRTYPKDWTVCSKDITDQMENSLKLSSECRRFQCEPILTKLFKTNWKCSRFVSFISFAIILNLLLCVNVNATRSNYSQSVSSVMVHPHPHLPVIPTSVSKAYTHIPQSNISRSSISRPFFTRMTPNDAKKKVNDSHTVKLRKPSKLFTNERNPLMSSGFDQAAFDSTTEKVDIDVGPTTTRKSTFSPFLTQTDTGPKIRLEPFFNILSTFQSLALGSSKEQKFSPSYQAVAQSVGVAEEQLKAKRNKGTKGLRNSEKRNKNKGNKNKFGPSTGGPVNIPLPKPVVSMVSNADEVPQFVKIPNDDDIITADSLQQGTKLYPMDVLSVSMSTSMSMGGGGSSADIPSTTPRTKGIVENVDVDNKPLVPSPLRMKEGPETLISITAPSLGIPSASSLSPPLSPKTLSQKGKKNRKHFSFTQHENGTGPESGERRLRSEHHFFENFHHTDSESDLLAEENKPVSNNVNANFPPGYALPKTESQDNTAPNVNIRGEDIQMISKYPVSFAFHPENHGGPVPLPPPALGLPPKSFFSLGGGSGGNVGYGIPYPKRPSFHNNYNPDPNNHAYKANIYGNIPNLQTNHQQSYSKPPEASSDLGEQQNAADSKLEASSVNPHQKIGLMDGFDLFYKQYKVLAWGSFFVVTSLALLCLIVFLYTNNPPTEVVTAKGLLSEWVTNPSPELVSFLSSIVDMNQKGGGNGKGKRKRFKMKRRNINVKSKEGSNKDLLQ